MDPIVLVIVIVVGTPLAVIWALAKSAQLRGPAGRREPRRPVGSLVTDAIPEEHSDEHEPEELGPDSRIESAQPDSGLRDC
jgi:hypothetical protein